MFDRCVFCNRLTWKFIQQIVEIEDTVNAHLDCTELIIELKYRTNEEVLK